MNSHVLRGKNPSQELSRAGGFLRKGGFQVLLPSYNHNQECNFEGCFALIIVLHLEISLTPPKILPVRCYWSLMRGGKKCKKNKKNFIGFQVKRHRNRKAKFFDFFGQNFSRIFGSPPTPRFPPQTAPHCIFPLGFPYTPPKGCDSERDYFSLIPIYTYSNSVYVMRKNLFSHFSLHENRGNDFFYNFHEQVYLIPSLYLL